MIKAIIATPFMWLIYCVIDLTLMILGFPIITAALLLDKVITLIKYRPSQQWPGRKILSWPRALWIYGNEEDGIDGVALDVRNKPFKNDEWVFNTRDWSFFKRVWIWSAWRNSVNNLRFLPFGGVKLDPKKIGFRRFGAESYFAWQGLYSCVRFPLGGKIVRIGWRIAPEDVYGVSPDDNRVKGAGFALQWRN